MPRKTVKNPQHTTLKSFGRSHRDEPFHLVYSLVLYPKKAKIDIEALSDWCAVRYLSSRKKTGTRYRIEGYRHTDGRRYVNRVMLENLTEDERVELLMRFGTDFIKEKQERKGLLRRPRLSKEEKKRFDKMRDDFYMQVTLRRKAEATRARGEAE